MADQTPTPEPQIAKAIEKQAIEKQALKEKPEKFEHKESKPEKWEHKESKPEKWEHKESKPEKWEHKEKLEQVEKFQIEKPIQIENVKFINEPGPDPTTGVDPVAMADRITQLETSVAALQHFIQPQDRPDLSQGALTNEPNP